MLGLESGGGRPVVLPASSLPPPWQYTPHAARALVKTPPKMSFPSNCAIFFRIVSRARACALGTTGKSVGTRGNPHCNPRNLHVRITLVIMRVTSSKSQNT